MQCVHHRFPKYEKFLSSSFSLSPATHLLYFFCPGGLDGCVGLLLVGFHEKTEVSLKLCVSLLKVNYFFFQLSFLPYLFNLLGKEGSRRISTRLEAAFTTLLMCHTTHGF
jgi:hypothetical protein